MLKQVVLQLEDGKIGHLVVNIGVTTCGKCPMYQQRGGGGYFHPKKIRRGETYYCGAFQEPLTRHDTLLLRLPICLATEQESTGKGES